MLSNNLPYHSFVFYRKGKDLSSITRQVSTIKLIHPFYDTPVFQTDGIMLPQKRTGLERKIVTKKRYADMGNNSRKQHGPEFKAKVALEALKEQATLPELEKKFGVSQYTISRWKNELLRNASQTFGATNDEEAHQKEVDNLHRKIGELEMMLDFAKRASRKLGVRLPEDL